MYVERKNRLPISAHGMNRIPLAIFLASILLPAAAEDTTLPKLVEGDRYVYSQVRTDIASSASPNRAEFKVGWVSREKKNIILVTEPPRDGSIRTDTQRTVYQFIYGVPVDECVVDVTQGISLMRGRGCRSPLEAGEQWSTSETIAGFPVSVRYTYAGEEEVAVPAGKFKAMKLRFERSPDTAIIASPEYSAREAAGQSVPRREEGTVWYAPSIRAKVRSESTFYKTNGEPAGTGTEELTAFKLK